MRRILGRRPQVGLLVATDGETGLAMAAEHRPDVILLDLHLPGCGGDEVLDTIRHDPALAGTPVVMITADVTPGTERRLTDAGATAFLPKPVDIARLLEIVDQYVAKT
jgi:CheY-like chemotaxis protein